MVEFESHVLLDLVRDVAPLARTIRPGSVPLLLIAPGISHTQQAHLTVRSVDNSHSGDRVGVTLK